MNLLPLIATAGGGGFGPWIYLILLIPIGMMFVQTSKQKKQDKARQAELEAMKAGDKVVTIGGFFGSVYSYNDDQRTFTLKLDPDGTKVVVKRDAIAYKINEEEL